jgi:D-ribose pyranose/furanose isomerase RbsD
VFSSHHSKHSDTLNQLNQHHVACAGLEAMPLQQARFNTALAHTVMHFLDLLSTAYQELNWRQLHLNERYEMNAEVKHTICAHYYKRKRNRQVTLPVRFA